MNNQATIEKMKLYGMQQAFELTMETGQLQGFTPDELLAHILDAEYENRQNRSISRLIKNAKFRYQASIEQINVSASRGLDKNHFIRLAQCNFIERKQNIIITGPTGVGKSYLATALGHKACIQGYKVSYLNTTKLFAKLKLAKIDGSYLKQIAKIEKKDLIIFDDFGIQPMDNESRWILLEIIEDRHGKKSTLITSQLPVGSWHDFIDEKTIADAILDRIIHTSHRIELKGDSLRKKQQKMK